jgi:general L-amino acid transport system permease protein
MTLAYVRTTEAPQLPAPASTAGLWARLRDRFAPTPLSGVAAAVIAIFLAWAVWTIFDWAVLRAVWSAPDREACNAVGAGACWPFVGSKWLQWIYGFYPIEQRWRPNIVFLLGALSLAGLLIPKIPYKGWNALFFFIAYPIFTYVLLLGGFFGLEQVDTEQWGGLLITLIASITGIVASVPLGILLALGRKSEMPVVRLLCTGFIEIVRGVPLVLVLFMAANMFPLFMPPGVNPGKLLLALIGIGLFSAAYMAEVIRGGLQAIPKGQYEASMAVGLSYWRMMLLVVMPQALKIVIPGIVNNFISLFKDTSLVSVIGIFDLFNIVQSGFNDATWASAQTGNTGYFALALIYWAFCFAMSRYSQYIERRLNTGHKR